MNIVRQGAAVVDCAAVGQGTAARSGHGAVVGQSRSSRHGEAGVLSDGQALALANGDVLLHFHLAVHSAALVVKDDAAAIITRWCRRRKRYRSS